MAKYLIEEQQCDPACKNNDGKTPLHSACRDGHLDTAKYLVEEQQCDPACKNNYGATPLHLACLYGHSNVAKYLIEEKQCNPSCESYVDNTPLLSACLNGHLTIAKYLIKEKQCNPAGTDNKGNTPLHAACQNGHLDMAKYLIEEQQCDPACKNNDGKTPLHSACQDGHLDTAKYLVEEQQCDPACNSNDGKTPLHTACQNGHLDMAKYLIEEQNCDPEHKMNGDMVPLHCACAGGHVNIAKYLIEEQHCDPEYRFKNSLTSLAFACIFGHLNIAKYLIEENHCNLVDSNILALSQLARCNGHVDLEKYLDSNKTNALQESSSVVENDHVATTNSNQMTESQLTISNSNDTDTCSQIRSNFQRDNQESQNEGCNIDIKKQIAQLQEEKYLLHSELSQRIAELEFENAELRHKNESLQEERQLLQGQLTKYQEENRQLLTAQQESVSFGIEPWKVSHDKVELGCLIGGGGWGAVNEGKLKVAVKQFYPTILSKRNLERLKREMRLLALIRHPNILQFIAAVFNEQGDHHRNPPYIITELLDTSLRAAYEQKELATKHHLSVFQDTSRALDYLHRCHEPIIHRDVSSANVLLKRQPKGLWQAKVSDLGSANLAQKAYTLNEGSLVYCAPEAFTDKEETHADDTLTTKVDVFSYGIMLCEVITGQFPEKHLLPSMLQQTRLLWPKIHPLIVSCVEHDPDRRPSMAVVLTTLQNIPARH